MDIIQLKWSDVIGKNSFVYVTIFFIVIYLPIFCEAHSES